jgi:glutathione S-transferase
MKLYYSPGACSLADHIALEEAGMPYELERVDLKSKTTESGADFTVINPKGYVPTLVFDIDEILTENLAILDWIAARSPSLGLEGPLGRTRLLEALAYLSSEVHKSFEPLFVGRNAEAMASARPIIAHRLALLAEHPRGPYLFGPRPSVADCYLFVMLLWAMKFGVAVPEALLVLRESMLGRPAVQKAMLREGLRVQRVGDETFREQKGVA